MTSGRNYSHSRKNIYPQKTLLPLKTLEGSSIGPTRGDSLKARRPDEWNMILVVELELEPY